MNIKRQKKKELKKKYDKISWNVLHLKSIEALRNIEQNKDNKNEGEKK